MDLILKEWIEPNFDISAWEFYDLSCKSRDDTEDQVSHAHNPCSAAHAMLTGSLCIAACERVSSERRTRL